MIQQHHLFQPCYVLSYRSYQLEIIKQLDNLSVTCSPCNNISYLHFGSRYSRRPIYSKCFLVYLLRKTWTPVPKGYLFGKSLNFTRNYRSWFKQIRALRKKKHGMSRLPPHACKDFYWAGVEGYSIGGGILWQAHSGSLNQKSSSRCKKWSQAISWCTCPVSHSSP